MAFLLPQSNRFHILVPDSLQIFFFLKFSDFFGCKRLQESMPPGLEQCLQLLRGERDEQRLAGLLLVPRLCDKADAASLLKAYRAVGSQFLDRLLKTGLGTICVAGKEGDDREEYLRLAVTVLAGFCRVPEIAAAKEMVEKVPSMLEVISKRSVPTVAEECYEFLFLVAAASDDGLTAFYERHGLKIVASDMPSFTVDSSLLGHAIKLLQLVFSKIPFNIVGIDFASELALMVVVMAKHFAHYQDALKFELLHILSLVLSSDYSVILHEALRSISNDSWPSQICVGVIEVLQNRVVPTEKIHALILAESMMTIFGENWLLEPTKFENDPLPIPTDRCLLLVLESSRVEVAVLLNELACIKYEASESTSTNSIISDTFILKQRNLAVSFSLIEKVVKLFSNIAEEIDCPVDEEVSKKVIVGLNETIDLILNYLQDAKEHGRRKGDDLLASVRVVGSYLAEAPSACNLKVEQLLEYILSVEGEGEQRPFYSVCFLLPMLCQSTMTTDGCIALTSFGGHKAVVRCLVKLLDEEAEDKRPIFLACDVILNILLKENELKRHLDVSGFIPLLRALPKWTGDSRDLSVIMMAASICALIFGMTSEDDLIKHCSFSVSAVHDLSALISRSFTAYNQGINNDSASEGDLYQIVKSGYASWLDRFPSVRKRVESQL